MKTPIPFKIMFLASSIPEAIKRNLRFLEKRYWISMRNQIFLSRISRLRRKSSTSIQNPESNIIGYP